MSSWLCLSSLFYSASCGALLEHIHRYLSSTRAHFLVVLRTILGSTHLPRLLSLTPGLDTTPLRGRPRQLLLGHDERDALSVRRSTSCLTSTSRPQKSSSPSVPRSRGIMPLKRTLSVYCDACLLGYNGSQAVLGLALMEIYAVLRICHSLCLRGLSPWRKSKVCYSAVVAGCWILTASREVPEAYSLPPQWRAPCQPPPARRARAVARRLKLVEVMNDGRLSPTFEPTRELRTRSDNI